VVDPPQAPTVTVVIPTFNRRESLKRVIDSVLGDPATAEIVVVVDGSSDGSIELLERLSLSHPHVKPVVVEHRGLNAALQVGVERAASEIVLILDDDLEAAPGLVSGHRRHHLSASNLILLGYSPIVAPDASGGDAWTATLYEEAYERSCRSFERRPQDILLHLYGGHMSIRRADALRIGIYSERFCERYHPDREFGIRCLKAGLTAHFDRALVARHHYARSLSQFRNDSRSQGSATAVIHSLHPDVLGPTDPNVSLTGAPAVARPVIRLSRFRPAHFVVSAALEFVVRFLGKVNARSLQKDAAKLLGRMEHQRGFRDALRRQARARLWRRAARP